VCVGGGTEWFSLHIRLTSALRSYNGPHVGGRRVAAGGGAGPLP
jgi:hypothetical protein